MRTWILVAVCAATMTAAPSAQAQISANLARQCREMMLKAHPTEMHGTTGTATVQREYFQECIRRQGKMDDASEPNPIEPSQPSPIGTGRKP